MNEVKEPTVSPSQERTLILPDSKFASAIRVRVSMRCNNCGSQWGVSFSNETLRLPLGFDVCNVCSQKKSVESE